MTVSTPENNQETTLVQEKIEDNANQKVQQNAQQPIAENKIHEEADKDPNWRAFREARKKDKAEREAAERRAAEKEAEVAALKAAMEAAFANGNNKNIEEPYPREETEDEKLEKRIQSIISEREAKAEKERKQREQQELPYKLKQAFPDYDQVVNEENGAYLEYHHPEVFRSLLRQPQNFETLCDTYKIVKKLIPNFGNGKKDLAKAEANLSKPKSISSTGLTQTQESSSIRLTEERKAANWERMQKTMKGVS